VHYIVAFATSNLDGPLGTVPMWHAHGPRVSGAEQVASSRVRLGGARGADIFGRTRLSNHCRSIAPSHQQININLRIRRMSREPDIQL
jgi:hypothetical protein